MADETQAAPVAAPAAAPLAVEHSHVVKRGAKAALQKPTAKPAPSVEAGTKIEAVAETAKGEWLKEAAGKLGTFVDPDTADLSDAAAAETEVAETPAPVEAVTDPAPPPADAKTEERRQRIELQDLRAKVLREQHRLREERAKLDAGKAEIDQMRAFIAAFRKDPYAVLEANGGSFAAYQQRMLSGDAPSPHVEALKGEMGGYLQKLEAKIDALVKSQETERMTAHQTAGVNAYRKELATTAAEHPHCARYGVERSVQRAYAVAEAHARETGIALDSRTVMRQVESQLAEEALIWAPNAAAPQGPPSAPRQPVSAKSGTPTNAAAQSRATPGSAPRKPWEIPRDEWIKTEAAKLRVTDDADDE